VSDAIDGKERRRARRLQKPEAEAEAAATTSPLLLGEVPSMRTGSYAYIKVIEIDDNPNYAITGQITQKYTSSSILVTLASKSSDVLVLMKLCSFYGPTFDLSLSRLLHLPCGILQQVLKNTVFRTIAASSSCSAQNFTIFFSLE